MRVQRAEMSRSNGARRSRSASSPPAITVSEPAAEAGGPPDTGRSTQRHPVCSISRFAWRRHSSTGMVEKSATSCFALTAAATPRSPNTASITASFVGRLRSTTSPARAASAGDAATFIPAACATRSRSGAMSYAVTSQPSLASRCDIGPPMRPTPI